jgi:phosphoribosylformylglycinamidine cyclo-ligase
MRSPTKLQDEASALASAWSEHASMGALGKSDSRFASWMTQPGSRLAMTSDGIGTKIEVAERMTRYNTLGADLVAMVVDDLAASGARPFALSNILDVNSIDLGVIDALMRGLASAALASGVELAGGEIAELGDRVAGYGEGMHFNWCATALGSLPTGWLPINGSQIALGDAIVALESTGMRSNGYTLARKTLETTFGAAWHLEVFRGQSWGDRLLAPSQIYAPALVALREQGMNIHGLAHVTGGGIPSKLGRVLRSSGFGADLPSLYAANETFEELIRLSRVSRASAYQHWNMSNGFLIVLPLADVPACCEALERFSISARQAGTVVAQRGIRIGDVSFEAP